MKSPVIKRAALLALAIILSLSSILLLSCRSEGGFFGEEEGQLETYEARRGSIIQTVSASGNIESRYSNSYSLRTSGEVLKALEEGDSFSKGDVLMELSSQRNQLLMMQAEENIRVSEVSLELARLSYQQALDANHIAVQLANTNTEQAELAAQNAFESLESANGMSSRSIESASIALENSQEIYDVAKDSLVLTDVQKKQFETNIESAEAAYESAKAQSKSSQVSAEGGYGQAVLNQSTAYWSGLSSTQSAETQIAVTVRNIEQAEAQINLARINYEIIAIDSDAHMIYAPYDGIVMSSVYKAGEYAGPGIPAMEVASSEFVIVSEVNETDIINIEAGQEVDIVFDAYYLEQLKGSILKVSPVPTNIGGIISYKVTVDLPPQERVILLPGLSASLTVTTSDIEDVLYIPIEAVSEQEGIQSVDVLLEDGSTEKRKVETGIFNYDFIEIKSGLSEGDIVVLSGLE
jgi:RND family efflux transporter MFP subunit